MYRRHRFPPKIIQHAVPQGQASRSGFITVSTSALAISKISWRSEGLLSATSRSDYGVSNSAPSTPGDFGVGIKVLVILFTSMKSLSEFKASNTIFGGQSTRMAKWRTYFYSAAGTERQQSAFSNACCEQAAMNRDESLPTSFEATVLLIENSSRIQPMTPHNMPTIERNSHINRPG